MFTRSLRFSFRKDVPKAKRVTPQYIVRFQQSEHPTFAVVAGKVVSKKSVERNRAKRVFTHALKEALSKQKNEFTLVFFLRAPFHEYKKSGIMETSLHESSVNSQANLTAELESLIREINSQT